MHRPKLTLLSILLIVAIVAVVLNSLQVLYEHREIYFYWQNLQQRQREFAAFPKNPRTTLNVPVCKIELESCWRRYQPSWVDLASHPATVLLILEGTRTAVLLTSRGILCWIGGGKSPVVQIRSAQGL